MMTKRKKQKEKTRQLLLKKAFELFAKEGILSTKTIEIAQAAQVSHGALFLHFPTREALLFAVINEFGTQIGHELQNQLKASKSLADLLSAHLDVLQRWEPFYAQLLMAGALLPLECRGCLFLIQSGIAHFFEQAFQKEHKNLKAISTPLFINTWLGLLHHYIVNRDVFAPGQSVLAVKRAEILDTFMKLIQK